MKDLLNFLVEHPILSIICLVMFGGFIERCLSAILSNRRKAAADAVRATGVIHCPHCGHPIKAVGKKKDNG